MAAIEEGISPDEIVKNLGVVDIRFKAKPYKYLKEGDTIQTITAPTTLVNPESFTAKPYMKIFGSGEITIYINDRAHSFKAIEGYIEVDSDMLNAYKGEETANNKMLTNLFPKFVPGENRISWLGNVTKIEIRPRWCTL